MAEEENVSSDISSSGCESENEEELEVEVESRSVPNPAEEDENTRRDSGIGSSQVCLGPYFCILSKT